uniref:Transcription and mRNA export factor ENY2 n=1 Tax=Phaeomonas parva TaxID=124430 RepID=A0A7S1UHA8_9STRA|eukprot:CAMPEP_0118885674 /NCGR_PEP_ID=MMETSP1163-20130328/24054_1 /TAXON_ID=124430 /ORGANISM="Phaeomonas parva, Strain CCMP2877" /LENGTH=141 /DNA_ID=CAMNT_0006823729 /DNA_START=172 /DNA_END=597 /DNA_ORIENTATION=-
MAQDAGIKQALDIQKERAHQDEQAKNEIIRSMIQTGQKDKIKKYLKQALLKSEWKEEVTKLIDAKRDENVVRRIPNEELVHHVLPQARDLVPEDIRNDILLKVLRFMPEEDEESSIGMLDEGEQIAETKSDGGNDSDDSVL